MNNKRNLPTEEMISKRTQYMINMKELVALEPINKTVINGLEKGNGKTGDRGRLFDRIFVWNLPPVITCPGLSNWCKQNCYNADDRYEIFPINKWCENLWWVINDHTSLKRRISSQLDESTKMKTAVRIHSSGDFFSKEYIAFWKEIISQNPNVHFWAYTRSWVVEELVKDIEELSTLDNMNLILSWDETMPQPINHITKSIVYNSNDEIIIAKKKNGGVICPEQYNQVACCADCGICISKSFGNIYFILH